MIVVASDGTHRKGTGPGLADLWRRPVVSGEMISATEAARHLGVTHQTLLRIARKGYVQGEVIERLGVRFFAAPLEEWRKGLQEYRSRVWTKPEGLESTKAAARRIGISVQVLWKLAREGRVSVEAVKHGASVTYYARPEDWDRAVAEYRNEVRYLKSAEARKKRARKEGMPRSVRGMNAEKLERRMKELEARREAFRAFVLAVMRGWDLPGRFVAREGEENALLEVV